MQGGQMLDFGKLLSSSDSSGHEGDNWEPRDNDGDGFITGADIPFEPGSLAAKKAWAKIEAEAHSPANVQKCKALGYEDGRGMYQGKVLVPGSGSGHGDFILLKHRLIYSQGYSPEVATKIAARAKWMIEGK